MANQEPESTQTLDEKLMQVLEELTIRAIRSGGPGGQSVNTANSQAELRWSVGESKAFTDDEKALIREFAGNRLNNADEIVIKTKVERQQLDNKRLAKKGLEAIIRETLKPKIERKPTKPSRNAKERRMDDKKKIGRRKEERKMKHDE